ncbi:hypothetical protein [Nocardia sp. NPDC050710]|uniref:PaaI family thioesterase n=1 Tax=Nocardia sp. NPDC050710 TaxID=3157220 RepID=UPI0033CA367B
MIQADAITIPAHVHGYPAVAFGGYVAGLLAARAEDATELRVDFRSKVPVDTPLLSTVTDSGGRALTTLDGTVLAETAKSTVTVAPPAGPSWAEARALTEAAMASGERRVTDCYGCGSACAPGRGLRLFPSTLPDRELIAAAWTPDPALAAADGTLSPENVWSALDCPGGWAGIRLAGMRPGAVTAALTATQLEPIPAGADYISYAWPISHHGRKYTVGVALTTPSGTLCALAEALWLEPREISAR